MREDRKISHIENYLKTSYSGDTLLSDVFIEHNPLPGLGIEDIDTKVNFLGKELQFPLLIDSMTGGVSVATKINEDIAKLVKKYGLAMAVGSQTISVSDAATNESFKIARETIGKDGIVIANMNAHCKLEDVEKAIEMIEANAVELHLNPIQELVMEEGDRDFKGIYENIKNIVKEVKVPVIVKEVGFGFGKAQIEKLADIGVKYIDIAGTGGTNFIEIEDLRLGKYDYSDLYSWGNPTAYSIIQAKSANKDLTLIGSGGIKTSLDAIKSVVLGADIFAMAGELLAFLMHGGFERTDLFLEEFIYKFKVLMILTGSKNISDLKKVPYKTTGKLRELIGD